jgi:uncharacterized protein YqfA (UPF0365 family)
MTSMIAQGSTTQVLVLVGVVLGIGFLGFLFIFSVRYGKLWIQAIMSRADVSLMSLIRMHFTKVDPSVIVQGKVMAAQAGLSIDRETGISTRRLESHYLANGNVKNIIHAIIAAQRASIPLDFDQASAIDLAGRDVLDAVQTSVYPKVIDCPDPRRSGKTTLSASKIVVFTGTRHTFQHHIGKQAQNIGSDHLAGNNHLHPKQQPLILIIQTGRASCLQLLSDFGPI